MSTPALGVPFVKGHGTGNDFVLIPDYDGLLDLSATSVSALCDRHRGLGADGVIRVVRSSALDESQDMAPEAQWFMDYRNADGSLAQMCGNGALVFARYLVDQKLVQRAQFVIATRGGVRQVMVESDGSIKVGMGMAVDGPAGPDPIVSVGDLVVTGTAHWMPNPHAVVFVDDLDQAGDLRSAPRVAPGDRFSDGVNVEFVVDHSASAAPAVSGAAPAAALVVQVRVYERGVGETLSCGTGACAVGIAVLARHGVVGAGSVAVHVPGGQLRVDRDETGQIWLSGPAVLVADGVLNQTWWKELA